MALSRAKWLAIALVAIVAIGGFLYAALALSWFRPAPTSSPSCGLSGCYPMVAVSAAQERTTGGVHWYNFSVVSASGGLDWDLFSFQVRNPNGTVVSPPTSWALTVLGSGGTTVGNYSWTAGNWTPPEPTAVVSNSQVVVLEVVGGPSLQGQGLTFVLLWSGAYPGSATAAIP